MKPAGTKLRIEDRRVDSRRSRARARANVYALYAGIAATIALASACSSPTSSEKTTPPAPEVGQCHRLSDADIEGMATYGQKAACTVAHNSYTYLVGDLDDLPHEPGALPATPARRACWQGLPGVLGRSASDVQATLFDFAAFVPTPKDQELGADWYRCDLIAHGRGWSYRNLPDGRPDEFLATLATSYYACIDYTEKSEVTTGERIPCSLSASHWWAGSFEGPSELAPGQLSRLMRQTCPRIAKTRYWYSTSPDPRHWAAGNHYIACYGAKLEPAWLDPPDPPAPA